MDKMAIDYEEGDRLLAWFDDDEDPEYEDPTPPTSENPTQQEMAKCTSNLRRIYTKNGKVKKSKAALTMKIISSLDSTLTVILETMVEPQPLKDYKTSGDAKGLLEVIQSYVFGYEEESDFPDYLQKQASEAEL